MSEPVSLDEWMKPVEKASAPKPSYAEGNKAVPLEEFLGTKPLGAELPGITEHLSAGQVDPKTGKEVREGFFANLKNPLHLWMKESLPANVYSYVTNRKSLEAKAVQSAAEESQDKHVMANPQSYPVSFVSAAERRIAEREGRKFSFEKIVKAAEEDPGKFGAEFANAIIADPILAFTPIGLGGGLSRAAAVVGRAKAGATGAAVGRVGGRVAEGAIAGAATQAPIDIAKQLATEGAVDGAEVAKSAAVAAGIAGPLAGLLGKTTKPRVLGPVADATAIPGKPHLTGPAGIVDEIVQGPVTDHTPPTFIAGEGGTVTQVKPRIKGPPAELGAVGDLSQLTGKAREQAEMHGLIEPGAEAPPAPDVPDSVKLLSLMAAGSAGALAVGEYVRRRDMEDARWERLREGTEQPQPTDEGTYLSKVPEWLMGPALVGMAVKEKGGMWHPEAVKRLAQPLIRKLEPTIGELNVGNQSSFDVDAWANDRIAKYLNKHAGTATDPLKDVQVPFGEGTKRWEELTDKAIKGTTREEMLADNLIRDPSQLHPKDPDIPVLKQLRPGETVWELPIKGSHDAQNALISYISHVGDYLRQNVDPAKLQQYDLVRAVKETAANDARVAKEMEKAASASMKDLPVYKEYPDGMKWVELKLPEKLTPEQTKSVRRATEDESANDRYSGRSWDDYWVAVDSSGKAIHNTYTGEVALGKNPRQAFLAGQLAQEGNQMGHCVGGYCEGVAAGESKIYSLRDTKGKSHVTVEVAPPDVRSPTNGPDHFVRVMGGDWLARKNAAMKAAKGPQGDILAEVNFNREVIASPEYRAWLKEIPNSITQIKGKGNRAPVAEYLPYVQDFVKDGKWGEVGDLSNTGLQEVKRTWFEPEQREAARARFKDSPYATEKEIQEFIRQDLESRLESSQQTDIQQGRLPRNQEGKVDPNLLFKLAALGIAGYTGASLDKDNALRGMGAGVAAAIALGMSPKALKALKEVSAEGLHSLDYGLGLISTRIKNISPALHHAAVELERNVLTRTHEALQKVDPFLVELNKVKDKVLDRALLTNDEAAIAARLRELKNPALSTGWRETRQLLEQLGTQLKGQGRFKDLKAGYFPRIVTDREGLLNALGGELKTNLEVKLHDADTLAIKSRGTGLTQVEQSIIINRFLQQAEPSFSQPSFAKGRKVREITEELEPFYASPTESLHSYLRAAVKDLEMVKFFGKDLREKIKGTQTFTDVDGSIGNVVRRELESGRIDGQQAKELQSMFRSRFISGERSTTGWVQDAKNLANAGLLGNVVSAATQIGDSFVSVYAQGLRPTLEAVGQILTNRKKVDMNQFGLADHISEEFVSTRSSAKFLNNMFKFGGFSFIDRLGKNINLNAAVNNAQRLSHSTRGVQKLYNKYGESFGADFSELVNDLRSGNITDRVESLAFHELSDVQPITKLESPQGKLELQGSPTKDAAATLYMLKSFMLKQLDIVRRDSYNLIKTGEVKNIARGFKNLTEYALVLGIGGATAEQAKNWIRGRDDEFEKGDVLVNVLKTFGWTEYSLDKVRQGKPMEAAVGIITPPYKMMDDVIIRRDPKAVRYIPLVGDWYYNRFMQGNEKAQASEEKRARTKMNRELRGE